MSRSVVAAPDRAFELPGDQRTLIRWMIYVGFGALSVAMLNGFGQALNKLGIAEDGPAIASAMEFILEGLHLNRRLNRDLMEGGFRYHV